MFPAILIQLIVALLVVGVVLWALSQFPIDPTISRLIRVVVVVLVAVWLIYLLVPLLGGLGSPVHHHTGPLLR